MDSSGARISPLFWCIISSYCKIVGDVTLPVVGDIAGHHYNIIIIIILTSLYEL